MKGNLSESDRDLLSRIDEQVQERFVFWFPDAGICAVPSSRGQVEVDYWSISYRLAFSRHAVFVKIPKMEMRQADIASILHDTRALESAQVEYDSFSKIRAIEGWPEGCSTVRPLAYLPEINAILTEYSPSVDLFRQCRRSIALRLFGFSDSKDIHESLRRCGRWLSHFQHSSEEAGKIPVDSKQLLEECHRWACELRRDSFGMRRLQSMLDDLKKEAWVQEMRKLRTCEGFEVRNIIVDTKGVVRLVDPGRLSSSSGLEDVAHFLVSLTMLYWGTPFLWFGARRAERYRQSFLDGWTEGDVEVSTTTLAWFEVRELCRQWAEAHRVVAKKPYRRLIRRFLRFAYVDLFFKRRIQQCIRLACSKPTRRAGALAGELI